MKCEIIGIGDYSVTNKIGEEIRTLGLGSCVALVILDRKTRTVGMAHIALPDSGIKPGMAKKSPAYFADTGVDAILEAIKGKGVMINPGNIIVKLAGGANVMNSRDSFKIGKRNVLAIRKCLWRYRLGPSSEDTGKKFSRSVSVFVDDGKVEVSSPGRGKWYI